MTAWYERVLVFGGTGSLGQTILREWSDRVSTFIVFGRDESKHWKVKQLYPRLSLINELGDIADLEAVRRALVRHNPTLIVVASAMKHITQCELYPQLCWNTNVRGLMNVLEVARSPQACPALLKLVFVSTDKACAPINIYGMAKSTSERILRQEALAGFRVPLVAVRYGNVINSSGSIIPVFEQQGRDPAVRAFTLTDRRMTRFIITLQQSVGLIEQAVERGQTGEIFIPHLSAMRIEDLAQLYSERYKKPVQVVGLRPGEKIHEWLYSDLEEPYMEFDSSTSLWIMRLKPVTRPATPALESPPAVYYSSEVPVLSLSDLRTFLTPWM